MLKNGAFCATSKLYYNEPMAELRRAGKLNHVSFNKIPIRKGKSKRLKRLVYTFLTLGLISIILGALLYKFGDLYKIYDSLVSSATYKIYYPTIKVYTEQPDIFSKLTQITFNDKKRIEFIQDPQKADFTLTFSNTPNQADFILPVVPCTNFKATIIEVPQDLNTVYATPQLANYATILQRLYNLPNLQTLEDPTQIPQDQVALLLLFQISPNCRVLNTKSGYPLDILYENKLLEQTLGYSLYLQIRDNKPDLPKTQAKKLGILKGLITSHTPFVPIQQVQESHKVSKITITGVTAITRGLLRALNRAQDPYYIVKDLKPIVSNADIVHTSNEVSFKPDCNSISGMRFCSDEKYFPLLTYLGINLVELTGNHNNDYGSKWNTYTIEKLYKPNNINYFGGGLNLQDASKPFITTLPNGVKVGFLGYNVYDTILNNPGPLAGTDKAGANPFSWPKVENDIKALKPQVDYVFVHLQYQECYAYPAYGVLHTGCYNPIPGQTEFFRKVADLGADFVIGTQAHQPQKFEKYNNSYIFYGLGNFLFDQIYWPGTRQGIVLQFYFTQDKLLQIRLIPTWQEKDYRVRPMRPKEAKEFLGYVR